MKKALFAAALVLVVGILVLNNLADSLDGLSAVRDANLVAAAGR